MPGSKENRRSARQILRIPVKLEILQTAQSSTQIFFGYTSNISNHGLALSVPDKSGLQLNTLLSIYIDGQDAFQSAKVPAKVSWQADSQCGLEFLQGHDSIEKLLEKAAVSIDVQGPFIKKFFPYVGGESIDTRKYEFSPYADKFITENAKTKDLLSRLRKGQIPDETASYFYAQYALADTDLNSAAVLSAYRAFREYRKFSVQKRRKILDDVRESLEKEKHNLIELLVIEGYPLKLAEEEYTRMLACVSHESLNYFERETMEMLTKNGDETVIGVRRPHGVVCVSPPRNPSSIAFMACLSLFAGNTLVLKPSASMPMFSIYLWKNIFGTILNENGAPKGTINIVMGDSRQFVQEWMANPYVKCIFYFSDEGIGEHPFGGGKHILRSSRGDSMVVWKDAPVEEAAEAALDCFISSSRMSMAPRKIFIHEEMYAPFIDVFSKKLQALKVGLPRDPETILSPAENEMSGFFEHLDETLRNGSDLLSGGYRVNYLGEKDPEGLFIAPTVIDVPVERYDLLNGVAEKTSFPVLSVFKIKSRQPSEREKDHEIYDQIVHLLEQSPDGLRASVWVRSPYYLRKFIEDLNQSGAVRFNSRYTDSFPYLFAHGMGQLGGLFEEMNQVWQKTSHLQWISITRLSLENSQVRVAVREA